MNCPQCGEITGETCRCDSQAAASLVPAGPDDAGSDLAGRGVSAEELNNDAGAWRDELSERLTRYRSRRKMRPPRYPSLRLPFETAPPLERDPHASLSARALEPFAESSLALDPRIPIPACAEASPADPSSPTNISPQSSSEAKSIGAKIIEFPRFAWAPPPPPPDQLAEPIIDRPRILEVPEVAPPPPALGGITIEPTELRDAEKRPGIDFPPQSASLDRRILAGLLDGTIVAAATFLFAFIFWKLAEVRPPAAQLLGLAAGIPSGLWAAYQYLLTVYSGRTPGLMAAGLELARFDGTPANRSLRRWRILASYLSAASLGMGYAWVFLDEDALCWHDRITRTYLAPKKKSEKKSANAE